MAAVKTSPLSSRLLSRCWFACVTVLVRSAIAAVPTRIIIASVVPSERPEQVQRVAYLFCHQATGDTGGADSSSQIGMCIKTSSDHIHDMAALLIHVASSIGPFGGDELQSVLYKKGSISSR